MNNIVTLRANRNEIDQGVPAGYADDSFARVWDASPLNFRAYERPLWYEGKEGTRFGGTGHKALVRMNGDKPVCLNVVGETYRMVQNEELFGEIHKGLRAAVSDADIAGVQIKDKVSYNGTQCFREYIFKNISFASPESDRIAFRVVVHNGFGTGAIKMYAGAIDFFCTNGVILGDYTSTYIRHTKGLQLSRFKEAVEGSVHMFWKNKDTFADLKGKKVLNDDTVQEWLEHHFGDRLGYKLFRQYMIEATTRGRNLWAVYSALTYYSSHNTGDFGLRNTGNDHEAATMMKRENDVRRIVNNPETGIHAILKAA